MPLNKKASRAYLSSKRTPKEASKVANESPEAPEPKKHNIKAIMQGQKARREEQRARDSSLKSKSPESRPAPLNDASKTED